MTVAGGVPAPERLMGQLADLDREVKGKIAQEQGFRKANSGFSPNETTQLLLAACEKLAVQKEAMDRAHFEEHTSELAYLCKHFGTSIDCGLSERAHRDLLSNSHPASSSREAPRRSSFFACCNREFPPQQSWWTDAASRLKPVYQVVRGGRLTAAAGSELVPGDILYLCAGQRCTADARVLVHEPGTVIDISHLTYEALSLRRCTAEATATVITDSANMVLRDSFVVNGALFCLVVSAPNKALAQSAASEAHIPDEGFLLDTAVPPGMSAPSCRTLYKQLCTKGRLACRSFEAMAKLARVQLLVVLLTQDLLERGSVPALAAAVKRLQRALVLVAGPDCHGQAVDRLAKELQAEVVDCVEEAYYESEGLVTEPGLASAGSPCFTERTSLRGFSRLSNGETRAKVETLATELAAKRSGCAVLRNASEAAILVLCSFLAEQGVPPLYAMGAFQYPACFRILVAKTKIRRTPGHVGGTPNPEGSFHYEEARVSRDRNHSLGRSSQGSAPSPKTDHRGGGQSGRLSGITPQMSRMASSSSQATFAMSDPAAQLGTLRGHSDMDMGQAPRAELVVSLNAIGVVSEHADCVLLTLDLGCLGQALELAARLAPAHAHSTSGDLAV